MGAGPLAPCGEREWPPPRPPEESGSGRGLLRMVGGCSGPRGEKRGRGVGGRSAASRLSRPWPLPPSHVPLTPELRDQQGQKQLRRRPGATDGGEAEVRGSHGQDLGVAPGAG